MKRKGRRHLPKVPDDVDGQLGFQYGAWTPMGTIERAGAFARGSHTADPGQFRIYGLVFLAIVAVTIIIAIGANYL